MRVRWLGVVLGLALVAAACGGNDDDGAAAGDEPDDTEAEPTDGADEADEAADGDPIIIGAAIDQSNQMAPFDVPAFTAAQITVDEINEAGGVMVQGLGRKLKVRLEILDDKSESTTSVQLTEHLINVTKVHALLGTYETKVVLAQSVVPERYQVPYVTGGGAASEIFKRNFRWVFGLLSSVESMGTTFMDWIAAEQDLGHTRREGCRHLLIGAVGVARRSRDDRDDGVRRGDALPRALPGYEGGGALPGAVAGPGAVISLVAGNGCITVMPARGGGNDCLLHAKSVSSLVAVVIGGSRLRTASVSALDNNVAGTELVTGRTSGCSAPSVKRKRRPSSSSPAESTCR